MPRKYIKRLLPDQASLRDRWYLRPFRALLQDPGLLHVSRRGTCKAFAVGLFVAFIPTPGQTIIAALGAIWLRVNLPVAVATVYITNPFTMGPMFYFCYKVGSWIMGTPAGSFHLELSWHWVGQELARIWQPFLLGCGVVGVIAAIIGYLALNITWQWYVLRRYRQRRRPA